MGGAASKNIKTEHFSLDDLLTSDDSVDMRKATIIIWKNRDKPEVISELADVLSEYSDQKTVFEGIEFYIPQLAHMIIHLEVDWPTAALEQFVLIVCQHSLHFALQLHFILVGAMEDYALEDADGRPTPTGEPRYYRRCAKLLQNVHRCVVYGSPRVHHLEELYRTGKLTKTELEEMGIAERRFNAAQILDPADPITGSKELTVLEGPLFYKRHTRRSCCHPKRWKPRWFKIQDRVLYCYNAAEGRLRRAIPLEGTEVEIIDNPRHEFYFEVRAVSGGQVKVTYMLKAAAEPDMQNWVKQIKLQSIAPTFLARGEEHMLYPAEYGRYQFFKSQRDFVNKLTDIAEEMRYVDRPVRTKCLKERLADVKLPEAAYLPLCKSTDPWLRILRIIPDEARAFSTKARCPSLVLFEVERDPALDVANYLHQRYGSLDEQGRPSGGRMNSLTLSAGDGSSPGPDGFDEDKVTPVPTLATIDASSRQHGQEAPLLLGRSLEDNERLPGEKEIDLSSSTSNGGIGPRRFSFTGISAKNLRMTPTLWRVGRPNISVSAELRKLPGEFRNAIRKRSRSGSHHRTGLDGSIGSAPSFLKTPGQALQHIELALGISSRNSGDEVSRDKDKDETPREERSNSDVEVDKIVPCYGEVWKQKRNRLRESSPFKDTIAEEFWDMQAVISKSNDDVRQEVFIMQLISFYEEIFNQSGIPIWLKPYKIISTGNSTGLIQFVTDAISIDALKKSDDFPGSLKAHFIKTYGEPNSTEYKAAQQNFAQSLAGYSIITYLLAIKDRHNGNIMIDKKGHIIHIDFGFVLGIAPGGKFSFERAPFKLTADMVDILGGTDSELFKYYVDLIMRGFKCARANAETAITLMEIMSWQSKFPCFTKMKDSCIRGFKDRLLYSQTVTDQQLSRIVDGLVSRSLRSSGTVWYDKFQLMTNGIKP